MRGDIPQTISLNDQGKAEIPPERFSNAAEVRGLCQTMIRADLSRSWMRNRVDALVNGWPTYPKSVTQAKGMGWFPRCNFRESEGLIAAQQTPIYDLITETDHCIDLRLNEDAGASSDQESQDWENTIQDEFTWLMFEEWRKSFNYHLPLSIREMLVHGLGAHVWPNDRWTPRTPRSGQILFPEGVSLDFENDGEYFCLREFAPSVNVYQFIRREQTATKLGWYPDNVWRTLAQAQRQNQKLNVNDVSEFQRRVRRGDLGYWSSSQVGLWLNWLFVKEYEGGISLYCVEENINAGNKDKGYLFRKRFMFDEWPLTLFPYDIGNGDLHSVVGLGWRTKDFFELSNRINNAMAVQILISALPQVKQTQPTVDPDKMKLMRMGGLSITPYGLDVALQQFPPLQNGGLALQQHLKDTMNENNMSAVGNSAPEPKDRETKYSFMVRSHDQGRVANGMQSLIESNLRDFYYKIYCRLVATPKGDLPYQKMAQAFRDRCFRKKVPPSALKESSIGDFKENTSTGAGSAAVRLQALQLLMNSPVYANAPVDKQIAAERATVATTLGGASVDTFARSINDGKPANIDESFATLENNSLAEGEDALIGDGQNDLMHARIHLQKGQELEQACEQGQEDPQKCLVGLQKILEHAGQHLANAKGAENTPEYKDLADQWRELARYLNTLQGQIESQQQQPSPQQQMSEDGMIRMQKLQQDSQIKTQKAQGDMALKFRKAAFNERLADVTTGASIARDTTKTHAGIALQGAKTQNAIMTNTAKTAASATRNGRG